MLPKWVSEEKVWRICKARSCALQCKPRGIYAPLHQGESWVGQSRNRLAVLPPARQKFKGWCPEQTDLTPFSKRPDACKSIIILTILQSRSKNNPRQLLLSSTCKVDDMVHKSYKDFGDFTLLNL